jgi:non-heme chloroperoxidase
MAPEIKDIKLPNQLTLQYSEKGDMKGTTLILLHGFGDSLRTFDLMLPFVPESIHTIALTMRGHGDSSKPERGYCTKDFEEDLVMFMDTLNIEKAVIAGASSGGFTARRFAANQPQRVLGLVLIAAPADLRNNKVALEGWESTISRLNDPISPEFLKMFGEMTVSKCITKEFLDMMVEENMKVPARVWKESNLGFFKEEFPGELNKIKAPTLILWGDKDKVLDKNDQVSLSNAIPDSKLIVYEGAGHLLYWDEPSRIASDMAAFVGSLSGEL